MYISCACVILFVHFRNRISEKPGILEKPGISEKLGFSKKLGISEKQTNNEIADFSDSSSNYVPEY